jgi:predicted DNA-binding protein (MmcQ/YjbR family)
VRYDEIVAYGLDKPGAVADQPWEGDYVAKVGGKIFVFHGPTTIGVKCGANADEAAEVRARFPDDVEVMAYIGRFGWNRVTIDGAVPDEELLELVDASYDAIVARLPKRDRPI